MTDEELPLSGGNVTPVTRRGDTVRRAAGAWTPAVHHLLGHLADAGFTRAPRVLGVDDDGREVLTYLPGTAASRPWSEALRGDAGPREIGRALRELADVLADYVPPAGAVWRTGAGALPGGPVRHGDLGPWNTVWDGDRLTGIIDWDFAEPAPPMWDLAQAAWYFVPLRPSDLGWRPSGFAIEPDARRRLRVLCRAYGADPVDVLDALADLQETERRRTATLGAAGVEPFASFLARGDVDEIDAEARWLKREREGLLSGA